MPPDTPTEASVKKLAKDGLRDLCRYLTLHAKFDAWLVKQGRKDYQ